jgi:hypothetical protein
VSKGREKEIAEIVADQAPPCVKAILKEPAKQRFIFRKRDHAVSNVSRGKYAVLAAKAARTSTVIGDGNDGREFRNGTVRIRVLVAAPDDIFLEAAEKRRKSGASAEGNDAKAVLERLRIVRFFLHRLM